MTTANQRHFWDTQRNLFPTDLPGVSSGGFYTSSPYAAAPAPGTRPARTATTYFQQYDAMGNKIGAPIARPNANWPGSPSGGGGSTTPAPHPTPAPTPTPTPTPVPTVPPPTTPAVPGGMQPAFANYLNSNGVLDLARLRAAATTGAYDPSRSAAANPRLAGPDSAFQQYLANRRTVK